MDRGLLRKEPTGRGQRVGYAVGGALLLLVSLGIVWADALAGRTGLLDGALIGGCTAGGLVLLYSAAKGRRIRWK